MNESGDTGAGRQVQGGRLGERACSRESDDAEGARRGLRGLSNLGPTRQDLRPGSTKRSKRKGPSLGQKTS